MIKIHNADIGEESEEEVTFVPFPETAPVEVPVETPEEVPA